MCWHICFHFNYPWLCNSHWKCQEYEGRTQTGNSLDSDYRNILNQCSTVAKRNGGQENYNGRGANFYRNSFCGGHRKRDNERIPEQPVQSFNVNSLAQSLNINLLREMISDEINDRRKHSFYNGQYPVQDVKTVNQNRILKNLKYNGELIEKGYPNEMHNVLRSLLDSCKIIYNTKNTKDYIDDTENKVNGLTDINTGQLIESQQMLDIQNTMQRIVKDCVCYSDCNGFGVCNCYGNCQCNYTFMW